MTILYDRPKRRVMLAAPVLMTLYQAVTVLAFAYGPWPWPVTNPVKLYTYLAAAVCCFFVSACIATFSNVTWRSPIEPTNEPRVVHWMIALMVIYALTLSLARTRSLVPSITFDATQFASNYGTFVEQNLVRGWWTYLEYVAALLTPAFTIALVATPVLWLKIKPIARVAFLGAIVVYLLTYAAISVNRGFFQIIVLLPATLGIYLFAVKRISLRVSIFLFFGAAFAIVLFALGFNIVLSYRDTTTSVGFFQPLNMYADRSGLFYEIAPKTFYTLYENITRYISNGYYGLSLALKETDYHLGFGLTSSMLVLRKANALLGDHWYFQTLLPSVEEHSGWSMWHLWHSAYAWFISDFGIAGSLIVICLFGALYGLAWRSLLLNRSIIPLALLYLLNMQVFYLSANNQLFQTADLFFCFVALFLIYLCGFAPFYRRFANINSRLLLIVSRARAHTSSLLRYRPTYLGHTRTLTVFTIGGLILVLLIGIIRLQEDSQVTSLRSADLNLERSTASLRSAELNLERSIARLPVQNPTCNGLPAEKLTRPFDALDTATFRLLLPSIDYLSDTISMPDRSPLVLCEDDRRLGPSHSAHVDIQSLRGGRYSHWTAMGLIFSTTDGSDANTNNRTYSIALDRSLQKQDSSSVRSEADAREHGVCAGEQAKVIQSPFTSFGLGSAYFKDLPSMDDLADNLDHSNQSTLTLCEDGIALGPAHSSHQDILEKGQGRFSHWRNVGVIFSASDNSDPNQNGRIYTFLAKQNKLKKTAK